MDEYLWPARNVAEYAYCPRLFYLMEVEGVHLANADTLEGMRVHKRVDSPSKSVDAKSTKPKKTTKSASSKAGSKSAVAVLDNDSGDDNADESPESDPILLQRKLTARSLTLTSEKRRLTATLDIAEIEGNQATPVEYRKGAPRQIEAGRFNDDGWNLTEESPRSFYDPWPTDRIQIVLQTLLLEEAGYEVGEGIIYYATTKQKLRIPITPELRAEALEILDKAQSCADGNRPDPLWNDGRCVRCSLQPFCLPDEVNYVLASERSSPSSDRPRSILPLREDGLFLVAQRDGVKIGVRGESLRFTDYDGRVAREIPLANVEEVALLGSVQISTQAIHTLSALGIPIIYLSTVGRPIAFIDPLDASSALTRKSQILSLENEERKVLLARSLVSAKIENQRTLLMRNHPNLPGSVPESLLDTIKAVAESLSVDEIRGHEGYAAKLYFEQFGGLFKTEEGEMFQANGRMRRPPPDPINATISFAYSMLVHECTAALRLARLDPALGALHVPRPGRPALSLDLMEPFRILIADSIAVSAFNRREFSPGHFQRTAAGCTMTEYGRRAFFSAYGRRMETEIRHPVFGYKLSYRRMLSLHAKMIAAWFRDEMETLSFLTTR